MDMSPAPPAKSLVLHSAARHYDLLAWLLTMGREKALPERLVDLARVAPGEVVLDVGCGTGSLAIAAKRRVGRDGSVHGIDASPEMIAQARSKSVDTGIDIVWEVGRAEALPYPDGSVDVVLSTLMMHHLPRAVREAFAAEIRRVLKHGGRALVVDFEPPAKKRGGLISRIHRHGHVPAAEIVDTLRRAELAVIEIGSVGVSDLHFALVGRSQPDVDGAPAVAYRAMPALPRPRWMLATAVLAVALAVHAVLLLRLPSRALAVGSVAASVVVVLIVAHAGAVGGIHALLGKHRAKRH